jgi:hypothetical protein
MSSPLVPNSGMRVKEKLLVVLMLARELDNVLFCANHMHEALKDWRPCMAQLA